VELLRLKGISALNLLNGDFAFAFLDIENEKLYLVRDRMGVKPLYYSLKDGVLRFGSEIKTILAAGLRPELNHSNLQAYFAFKYSPGNDTLFKGVKRVPPAHYLCYDLKSESSEIHSYWTPEKTTLPSDYSGRCEMLRELIADAVQLRLVSDVPVSTFLSGGLDSSIIASFLKGNHQIAHYCAVKNAADIRTEGTTSDGYFAEKLARDWHLSLTSVEIGGSELSSEMIDLTLRYSDDLIADGSQIPSWLITKKASENSTVVLTGMGADELFCGYAGHIITRWAGAMDRMPSVLTEPLINAMASVHPGKGRMKSVKRYLYKLGRYYHHPHRFAPLSIVGDWNTSCSVVKGNEADIESFISRYDSSSGLSSLQHFERDNFLVKNLHYTDRMSMANGMESRVPFLDHRIVELAYSLPFSDRIGGIAITKKILKDSFSGVLPGELVSRRKAGFGMPLRSLFSGKQTIDKLLNRAFFGNFEGFSVEAIDGLVNEHLSGRADHSALIYALISFERWYKMYIEN
jgi:asparagine synthase (glutamine-hydrolysing)